MIAKAIANGEGEVVLDKILITICLAALAEEAVMIAATIATEIIQTAAVQVISRHQKHADFVALITNIAMDATGEAKYAYSLHLLSVLREQLKAGPAQAVLCKQFHAREAALGHLSQNVRR